MYLCLRVDLDYVPWDTPDAKEFGHGEPALVLRLIELGKSYGYRYHFFVSNRVMRAFPTVPDVVLNDGHDLDWFCKHPEEIDTRFSDALELFRRFSYLPNGFCIRGPWPEDLASQSVPSELRFLSASPGPKPPGVILIPVDTRTDRETMRAGASVRAWTDELKAQLRQSASLNRGMTIVLRPQVLAQFDPRLTHVKELIEFADAVGLPLKTLRDVVSGRPV